MSKPPAIRVAPRILHPDNPDLGRREETTSRACKPGAIRMLPAGRLSGKKDTSRDLMGPVDSRLTGGFGRCRVATS
jgi:hypothetical protein